MSWPTPLHDGTFLLNRPKGIHKPAGWEYTLSVRQMMSGPYADSEPALQRDGSWHYQYFQEGTDPALRDSYYANVGLMACIRDRIPIGVFRQTAERPHPLYKVMGLAWVWEWRSDGYFMLAGLTPEEETLPIDTGSGNNDEATKLGIVEDVRKKVQRSILERRGQGQFRAGLLIAYQGRCAISKYDAASALEAAHIDPYGEGGANLLSNGLLLRADLHTLFDEGLVAIDGESMSVIVSQSLSGTMYSSFAGIRITEPLDPKARPDPIALAAHRAWANL